MPTLHCSSLDPVSFLKPPQHILLPDNTVHLWKFPVTKINPSLLSEKELVLAERFRQESDRLRFTTGRQMLRMLSSKYLSIDPRAIEVYSERRQKPVISNSINHAFHFNISHSGQWVLIAFADSELGVDIEEIKISFSFQTIVQDQFSEPERNFLLNSSDPLIAFYTLWIRKEALLKAWGTGLKEDLWLIPCLDGVHELTPTNISWRLNSFRMEDGYEAALAYAHQIRTVQYFDGSNLIV